MPIHIIEDDDILQWEIEPGKFIFYRKTGKAMTDRIRKDATSKNGRGSMDNVKFTLALYKYCFRNPGWTEGAFMAKNGPIPFGDEGLKIIARHLPNEMSETLLHLFGVRLGDEPEGETADPTMMKAATTNGGQPESEESSGT